MLTRPALRALLWTLPLLLSTLACRAATQFFLRDPSPSSPLVIPTSIPEISSLPARSETEPEASCPSALSTIMAAATALGGAGQPEPERRLVTYNVIGEQLSHPVVESVPVDLQPQQDDVAMQQKIWNYFAALIPQEQRGMISHYSILTDGKNNLLAAVAQTSNDPSQWVLEVDIADAEDTANLTFTMIHEFGHLLTLNSNQVPPSMAVIEHPHDENIYNQQLALCPSYFTGEGCSNADSYIHRFYRRFWSDIYNEWRQIDRIQDDRDYYENMSQFYFHYEDRFVSEYASTNPAEDIAESWAYFVLGPKPTASSMADQKVLFFYEHPELVTLRAQILSRLCTIFPQ